MPHHGDQTWWWMGGWGWLWLVLVTVLIVLLAVWVIRQRPTGGSDHERPGPPRDALAILEERFARGEIDREEFEERRRVLRDERE